MTRTPPSSELLEIGLRAAGADRAAAYLWDSEQGGLALAAAKGYETGAEEALEAAAAATDHPVQLAAQERIQTTGERDGGRARPVRLADRGRK